MRAYIDGKWRTVQAPREIERGRNQGRMEVKLNMLRKVGTRWKMMPRPVILDREQIVGD
jgi:hypothetical protein